MITAIEVTASVATQPSLSVPYHLCLRRKGGGYDMIEWHEYEGRPMDYWLARRMLVGVEQLLPALHRPGAKYYLIAEPYRPVTHV